MTDRFDPNVPPRQSVILAAGSGTRLRGADPSIPKPLVQVAGRALIEHALGQAEAAGCSEAIVVVGSRADLVRAHVEQLTTPLAVNVVLNDQHALPNGVSLLKAEPHISGPFYLQMADHVFEDPVLRLLAEDESAPATSMRLLVDRDPPHLDEADATKVRIAGTRITAIGKELEVWDAIDSGFFLLDPTVFGALRQAGCEEQLSVSAGMRQLIKVGRLAPVFLRGVQWMDIDTPQDWSHADTMFRPRSVPNG